MYKVIGVDGKEYGPINLDQFKQWIAQGRVNAQTRVQPAGATDWKTATDIPEIASLLPHLPVSTPPPFASGPGPAAANPDAKKGLAVASLVLGLLSFLTCFLTGIPAIICGHIAYSRARRVPAEFGGSGLALAGLIMGYVTLAALPLLLIPGAMLLPALQQAKTRAQRINCVNNMKQIGLAFRTWALDHGDQYPFNVSTNAGGTLELCALGADGFDANAALHFMVLSNELATPLTLVCPGDNKQPAIDFQHLQPANVSYLLRSGSNVNDTMPQMILAICPIHHNVLLSDGSVQALTEARLKQMLDMERRSGNPLPLQNAPAQ
jgi:Domain of unknown function (DUF4190)/GYF domain 2